MDPEKRPQIALDFDPHTPFFGGPRWRGGYSRVLLTQRAKLYTA